MASRTAASDRTVVMTHTLAVKYISRSASYYLEKGKVCHCTIQFRNGNSNGDSFADETLFRPDIYSYPFECSLPDECPTSLEGDSGYIRYSATVVIDCSGAPPKAFVQYFSVLKRVDLNAEPLMRVSLVQSIDD